MKAPAAFYSEAICTLSPELGASALPAFMAWATDRQANALYRRMKGSSTIARKSRSCARQLRPAKRRTTRPRILLPFSASGSDHPRTSVHTTGKKQWVLMPQPEPRLQGCMPRPQWIWPAYELSQTRPDRLAPPADRLRCCAARSYLRRGPRFEWPRFTCGLGADCSVRI